MTLIPLLAADLDPALRTREPIAGLLRWSVTLLVLAALTLGYAVFDGKRR